MFDRFRVLSAVFGLVPMTRLLSEVISSIVRLPKTPRHFRSKHYQHSSTRQRERGARQIASGMCTQANGLVRPGQIINKDGRMFVCRPYF